GKARPPCPLWVKSRHFGSSAGCPLYPRKRTSVECFGMSAKCQKQTFKLLLDIIVGGQGCSSSWSITRETSPPEFLASGRRRCCAAGSVAHRTGADLSVATGASDRATCPCRRVRHHGAPDRTMAVGAARPAICYRQQAGWRRQRRHRGGRARARRRLHASLGRW